MSHMLNPKWLLICHILLHYGVEAIYISLCVVHICGGSETIRDSDCSRIIVTLETAIKRLVLSVFLACCGETSAPGEQPQDE